MYVRMNERKAGFNFRNISYWEEPFGFLSTRLFMQEIYRVVVYSAIDQAALVTSVTYQI